MKRDGQDDGTPIFDGLTTCHGSRLVCETASGRVAAAVGAERSLVPIVLCRFAARPDIGFLVACAPAPVQLVVEGETIASVALSMRVAPGPIAGRWALRRPLGAHHLCSEQPLPGRAERVVLNRHEIGDWEQFGLDPMAEALVPQAVRDIAARLGRALHRLTGPSFLALLEEDDRRFDPLLETLGRLLTIDELRWLGARLLRTPRAVERLRRALPGDLWAQRALPDLATWLGERDADRPHVFHLPPSLDFLSTSLLDPDATTFGLACVIGARRDVAPRRDVCVLTTARNEGIYLLDWIAYHRSIGAAGIFIYSNGNDDGSDELLALLAEHREITWTGSDIAPGTLPQFKAYGHALCVTPYLLDYRWTLCIDMDEYFGFDTSRFASLVDYIRWQEANPVDAIALSWQMFSSGDEARWRDAPIWQRFERRDARANPHVKTLFRTNLFRHSWCHDPVASFGSPFLFRDSVGGLHHYQGRAEAPSFSSDPRADTAWINHYFARSAEEFAWKKARNTGDTPVTAPTGEATLDPGHMRWFLSQHDDRTGVVDRRMRVCAAAAQYEKARLLALPGVDACNERIKATFRTMSKGILDRANRTAMLEREDGTMARFMRLFVGSTAIPGLAAVDT